MSSQLSPQNHAAHRLVKYAQGKVSIVNCESDAQTEKKNIWIILDLSLLVEMNIESNELSLVGGRVYSNTFVHERYSASQKFDTLCHSLE